MSILKYKYKAHKFINYAFYIVVFIFGFLLGFTTQKLDFNKLISQVLMIDNVSAYTIEYQEYSINEQDIYNKFKSEFPNFDINIYNKIICTTINYSNYGPTVDCYASNEQFYLDRYNISEGASATLYVTENSNFYRFFYRLSDNSIIRSYYEENFTSSNNTLGFVYLNSPLPNIVATYSNFSFEGLNDELNKRLNVLDFGGVNLQFNENLFKDNPDFKEVCVNNYDTFSITSNEIQDYTEDGSPLYHSFDFIWFPNGMKGLSTWGYDSEEHDHVYTFEKSDTTFSGWWYWLNNKDEIDLYFDRDNPGMYLRAKGYKNKYDYYNWTFYPFEMTLTDSYHRYQVFWFKDAYIEYLNGSKKEDNEQYCFYIKNEYDVNILKKNQNGDFESTITILGGINKDDVTYENELNNNSNGFFSTVNNFISQIRPTVLFINSHILKLFTAMPLIVRSFIISFLVLVLIRILIGMVVR